MKYLKSVFLLATLILFSCQGQNDKNVQLLDAKSFSAKITNNNQIQLIDVRTPEEFKEQQIGEAKNINWNGADFEEKILKLDKSKPIYIYCRSGARSKQATSKLTEMGFTEIYELEGGILSWNKTFN